MCMKDVGLGAEREFTVLIVIPIRELPEKILYSLYVNSKSAANKTEDLRRNAIGAEIPKSAYNFHLLLVEEERHYRHRRRGP